MIPTNTLTMSDSKIAAHERHASNDPLRFFRKQFYTPGELSRLSNIVRDSGTTLILPYDQFVEHDNRHAEADSDAANPDYICELAVDGGYNAIAVHYGVSKRFWAKWAGKVPLILKLNGKTSIPSQAQALSVHTSYVEDAVQLGAVAVGYTMYYGSPRQDVDLPQLATVRKACDRYGLPLIVWAYPRGEAIDGKGGPDSSYAIESATRMAMEMGATVIKANLPVAGGQENYLENEKIPEFYRNIEKDLQELSAKEQKWERARRVVEAAQGTPVLFSGGSKIGEEDLMENAQACVDAGCFGFIFGRNMWKREKGEAVEMTKKFQVMLDKSA